MPRRLPAQEMHSLKRLPSRRRCHVAQDRRQKSSASRLAGELYNSPFIPLFDLNFTEQEFRMEKNYCIYFLFHFCEYNFLHCRKGEEIPSRK